MTPTSYIFQDNHGRRWRRVKLTLILAVLLLFGAVTVFVHSLFILPQLGQFSLPSMISRLEKSLPLAPESLRIPEPPPEWLRARPRIYDSASLQRERKEHIVLAFYSPNDQRSLLSLRKNSRHITHVAPEWLYLGGVEPRVTATPDPELQHFLHDAEAIRLIPILSNFSGGEWQPEAVETLARGTSETRLLFFEELSGLLTSVRAGGVILDWQQIDPALSDEMTSLISSLARYLHERALELWLQIPLGNEIKVFDLDSLSDHVDRYVATLFFENGEDDPAGPVASQPWWEEWWRVLQEHGKPSQWIAAIGAFGYDWPRNKPGTMISFTDAMARAALLNDASVDVREPVLHPNFTYLSENEEHSVWFLDAVTFRNQARAALRGGGPQGWLFIVWGLKTREYGPL